MTRTAEDIIKEAEQKVQQNKVDSLEKKASEVAEDMITQRTNTQFEKLASESPLVKLAMDNEEDIFATKSFRVSSCLEKVAAPASAVGGFLAKMMANNGARNIAIGAGIGAGGGMLANKDDRMGGALKGALLGGAAGAGVSAFKSMGTPATTQTFSQFKATAHPMPSTLQSGGRSVQLTPKGGIADNVTRRQSGYKAVMAGNQKRMLAAEQAGIPKHNALANLTPEQVSATGAISHGDKLKVIDSQIEGLRANPWYSSAQRGIAARDVRTSVRKEMGNIQSHLAGGNASEAAHAQFAVGSKAVERAGQRRLFSPSTWMANTRATNQANAYKAHFGELGQEAHTGNVIRGQAESVKAIQQFGKDTLPAPGHQIATAARNTTVSRTPKLNFSGGKITPKAEVVKPAAPGIAAPIDPAAPAVRGKSKFESRSMGHGMGTKPLVFDPSLATPIKKF